MIVLYIYTTIIHIIDGNLIETWNTKWNTNTPF